LSVDLSPYPAFLFSNSPLSFLFILDGPLSYIIVMLEFG
jgi:hypothetical protein